MNDFLRSVRTPPEAIERYQKMREVLGRGGFKLTKWITSDDEDNSQISETERSTKYVKPFEAEPQPFSILGLNRNVDTESPIVCRGTEQEVQAKKSELSYRLSQQSSTRLGYVHPTYKSGFYLKAFEKQWGKHGTRSFQQTSQNFPLIGTLS